MVNYMKCIKTGCNVICEGKIFHGDLMYYNGIVILSGVPYDTWCSASNNVFLLKQENKKIYYDFQAKNLSQIPGTGSVFAAFIVEGVFDVQNEFINQIKNYEKKECIALFE